MGVAEYRYRTLTASGSLRLNDKSVVSEFNQGFRSWQDEIPYETIIPNQMRTIYVPSSIWACAAVGAAAIAFGIWGAVDREGTNMSLPLAVAVICAGAGLASYSVRYGRETWIWYPTYLGCWVRFCNKGTNSSAFESFAVEIHDRIARAQRNWYTRVTEVQ